MEAAVIQFQKKQQTNFICSACGADRSCNCNAPAIEKLAGLKEKHRIVNREHARRKREQKQESVDIHFNASPIEEDFADCDTPEQIWYRGLRYRAGEAIAGATTSNWRNQYGDYTKFKVSTELVTLAEQAAAAWRELAGHLRGFL